MAQSKKNKKSMSSKKKKTMMCHEFSTAQISKIINESIDKTITYVKRGYIQPSIQAACGHGSRRIWSYADVLRFIFVKGLLDVGLRVEQVRDALPSLSDDDLVHSQGKYFVIHPTGVFWGASGDGIQARGQVISTEDKTKAKWLRGVQEEKPVVTVPLYQLNYYLLDRISAEGIELNKEEE